MFYEVELVRDVEITVEKEKRDAHNFQRYIITCLLENLLKEKANKDHGYFLSVTSLKSIGKGVVKNESQCVSFPITFICRTFLPFEGEILHGVVRHIFQRGLLLKCGPIKYAFLSARKMPTYQYVGGENPVFSSKEFATIGNDVVVRFSVLGVRWIEKRGCIKKEFVMLASLEVSLSLRVAEQEKAVRELMVENTDEATSIGRRGPSNSGPKECEGSTSTHHQHEQGASYPKEWDGITSKELSESVLLEAAFFRGVSDNFSENNSQPASHLQNDKIQGTSKDSHMHPVPCHSIPSSSTQPPRQQQKETMRSLAAQEAPFPPEPEINDKNSVTLLLRLPDGHRHERRFLKSDKLQLLFNFIDDKLAMKPGTYKVARPYPRCTFGVEDGSMMLSDLGLTGKQEALFVELI